MMSIRWFVPSSLIISVGACTNFMVSPGASADGSTLMSYSCDGPPFAALTHYPAQTNKNGTMRQLTRKGCGGSQLGPVRGEVPEADVTYNVVGLINEHAVSIGETTFGGISSLRGTGLLTYGDVMELALQRSKSAREMIKTMDSLVREYGYGGTPNITDGGGWGAGESFTIADTTEVWHMEMMGKGKWDKGAVWVAQRVPDGYIGGHANQARITTFPRDDPENCLYSADVVDFAIQAGLYPADAPKEEFSFAAAYDPLTVMGARKCDARVWSFFSRFAEDGFEKRHEEYILGRNLTVRMPLFVKAERKIQLNDFFGVMRNHYEDTVLDDRGDVGAGPFHSVFRNGPSSWRSGGRTYVNERHVGVPVASTHYTAQLRGWLPAAIGGINWFSVDDSTFSVHAPFRGSATRIPKAYSLESGGAADVFSFDAAWWVFNMVANFAYYRYDIVAPLVTKQLEKYEKQFVEDVAMEDKKALSLWKTNATAAVEFLTAAAEDRGNALVKNWLGFYQQLFMMYRDGSTPNGVKSGYGQDWYDRIAKETGDKYLIPAGNDPELNLAKLRVLNKGHDVTVDAPLFFSPDATFAV